jgi:hypothetical protein
MTPGDESKLRFACQDLSGVRTLGQLGPWGQGSADSDIKSELIP